MASVLTTALSGRGASPRVPGYVRFMPFPHVSRTALSLGAGAFSDLEHRIQARMRAGADLVGLHLGDTCRRPPQAAIVALEAKVEPKHLRYGPTAGLDALREAIARHLHASGARGIEPRHVYVGAGATHALYCAARAIMDPGDAVLVCAPYWPLAPGVFRNCSVEPIEVTLSTRLYEDPSLDPLLVLEEAWQPHVRALYFISPNNPDGKVLSPAQLRRVAEFALAKDIWLIADEVYADLTYEEPHASILHVSHVSEVRDRTVTMHSLSKSHALAGARVGYITAPEEIVHAARRIGTHTVFNVPVVSQLAAAAALESGQDWVIEARAQYRDARDATARELRRLGVRFSPAEGATYLFLDLREALGSASLPKFLEHAIDEGVLLAPGAYFGRGFESYARLCFTSEPLARVLEGVLRLGRALETFTR